MRFHALSFGKFLVLATLLSCDAVGQEAPTSEKSPPVLKAGANCLFIGHSFFVPVAKRFDVLADRSEFPNHEASFVFAPGMAGSPKSLYQNERKRTQIQQKLAEGNTELFGMTIGGPAVKVDDYQRWIDIALKHNPNTKFFIGNPWMIGGPKMDLSTYKRAIERSSDNTFEIVKKLRQANPTTHIYFVNYGHLAAELRTKFEADQLPDITKVSGFGNDALFRDGLIGHGSAMMLELSAAIWAHHLYGADVQKLKLPEYQADVNEILETVIRANEKFQSKQ